MKGIVPIIIVVILIALIATMFFSMGEVQDMTVVKKGTAAGKPVEMVEGHFQCSECGMIINNLQFAAQVTSTAGKTWFFDDHGCMAAWISRGEFQEEPALWVPDLVTGEWIDGRAAWYSRTDSTPMSYGFGAYSTPSDQYIDFATMQMLMLKGETFANPSVRKELLGN